MKKPKQPSPQISITGPTRSQITEMAGKLTLLPQCHNHEERCDLCKLKDFNRRGRELFKDENRVGWSLCAECIKAMLPRMKTREGLEKYVESNQ